MFTRQILSLLVVLSLVAQVIVLTDTEENQSNFVEDSSPLQQLPEYGGARGGGGAIELIWDNYGGGPSHITSMGDYVLYTDRDAEK